MRITGNSTAGLPNLYPQMDRQRKGNWTEILEQKRMQDLLAARVQMGISLAFHIVFACVGVAMPLLMAIAEWRYLKTGDEVYYTLARRWAVGTAIMFAVGAVSGTVLLN
jgi:hypothetical protein